LNYDRGYRRAGKIPVSENPAQNRVSRMIALKESVQPYKKTATQGHGFQGIHPFFHYRTWEDRRCRNGLNFFRFFSVVPIHAENPTQIELTRAFGRYFPLPKDLCF
jgi:hypothetical protein